MQSGRRPPRTWTRKEGQARHRIDKSNKGNNRGFRVRGENIKQNETIPENRKLQICSWGNDGIKRQWRNMYEWVNSGSTPCELFIGLQRFQNKLILKALHMYIHITGCSLCVDFWRGRGRKKELPALGFRAGGQPQVRPMGPDMWPGTKLVAEVKAGSASFSFSLSLMAIF